MTNSEPRPSPAAPFYVTGGTMPPGATSYVEREADGELFRALQQGELSYVLTSRQMGKSSLMVRTARRLREAGVLVVVLDVTAFGQNLSPEQWYEGLTGSVGRQLDLEDELERSWLENAHLGPLQRFIRSLERVVLEPAAPTITSTAATPWSTGVFRHLSQRASSTHGEVQLAGPREPGAPRNATPVRLVVFIDEIDFVRSLPFPTDELFAAIRECFNRRAEMPELSQLTFCLLGVATPADLIQDVRTTPFNIGRRIELTDFAPGESQHLAEGLRTGEAPDQGRAARLFERVLYWTGGQPYLCQLLCREVRERLLDGSGLEDERLVDRECERLFLSPGADRRDDNLLFVRERVLRGGADPAAVLELYRRIRSGGTVPVREEDPLHEVLRLSGLVRSHVSLAHRRSSRPPQFQVRNRIYHRVFDANWIRTNMPGAELRRQRAAFRRGLARAAAVGAVLVAVVGSLAAAAFRNEGRAQRLATSYQNALVAKEDVLRRLSLSMEQVKLEQSAVRREAQRAGVAELLERKQRTHAERQSALAKLKSAEADLQRASSDEQRRESRRRLVRLLVENGTQAQQDNDPATALLWFAEALKLEADNPQRAEIHRLRIADTLRFCPRITGLWTLPGELTTVAMSADGARLAAATKSGTARIWDVRTRKPVGDLIRHTNEIRTLAFSPDSRKLATGSFDRTIRLWDARTGTPLLAPMSHSGAVHRVTFSADGSRLLGVAGQAFVWSASTGALLGKPIQGELGLTDAELSPDGNQVLIGAANQMSRLWDPVTGLTLGPELQSGYRQTCASFSPNGRLVATGTYGGSARIWNAWTGTAVTAPLWHEQNVTAIQFSPDGASLVTASTDRTARVWDVRSGAPRGPALRHSEAVLSARFTADGARILTTSEDRTVRVWNSATGEPAAPPLYQGAPGRGAVTARDERHVVTASADGVVRMWDLAAGAEGSLSAEPVAGGVSVRVQRDGKQGLTLRDHGPGRLWRGPSAAQPGQPIPVSDGTQTVEFSPNGAWMAAAAPGSTQIWNIGIRRPAASELPNLGTMKCLTFSPDSRQLAIGGYSGTVWVWNPTTARLVLPPLKASGRLRQITYSGNGKLLATVATKSVEPSFDGQVQLWDASNGKELELRSATRKDVSAVALSPDGRWLSTACRDGLVRSWNTGSGEPASAVLRHSAAALQVRFSPEGSRVVTASEDGTARVWRLATGRALTPPLRHSRMVQDACFSPDGLLILTRCHESIRVWDALSGEPVTMPLPIPKFCAGAWFTGNRSIITENGRGGVVRWELAGTSWAPEVLTQLAELLSGQRLGEEFAPVALDSKALFQNFGRLQRFAPELLAAPVERELAWHSAELDRSELDQQWRNAVRHASRLMEFPSPKWPLIARRAAAYAELDQWAAAAADYQRAADLGADDRLVWYRLALTQLASGDEAGYQRTSLRMLDRFANSQDPREPDISAWARALRPGSVETAERALRILPRGSEGHAPDPSLLGTIGALQLRAQRYGEATRSLEQAIALRRGEGTVPDHLFLAMALARSDRKAEAQSHLARAQTQIRRAQADGDSSAWEDRLEQALLAREAEALLH